MQTKMPPHGLLPEQSGRTHHFVIRIQRLPDSFGRFHQVFRPCHSPRTDQWKCFEYLGWAIVVFGRRMSWLSIEFRLVLESCFCSVLSLVCPSQHASSVSVCSSAPSTATKTGAMKWPICSNSCNRLEGFLCYSPVLYPSISCVPSFTSFTTFSESNTRPSP